MAAQGYLKFHVKLVDPIKPQRLPNEGRRVGLGEPPAEFSELQR